MKRFCSLLLLSSMLISPMAWSHSAAPNEQLSAYFKPAQVQWINQYRQDFQQIKKLQHFIKVYQQAVSLEAELSPALGAVYEKYDTKQKNAFEPNSNFLHAQIPGLKTEIVAEGTNMIFSLDFKTFGSKARQTPEPDDDLFVAAMTEAYGAVESYPGNWFTMTWDLGGCSNLGSGQHLKILQKSALAAQKNAIWKPYLNKLREILVRDIVHSGSYCHSQPKILSELNQLLQSGLLKSTEHDMVKQRKAVLQTNPKDIEFACSEDGANCGYGA